MLVWKRVLDEDHKTETGAHDVSKITNARSATEISDEIDGDIAAHDALATVHTAAGFAKIPKQATAPVDPTDGDMWYDTINKQLKIWVA